MKLISLAALILVLTGCQDNLRRRPSLCKVGDNLVACDKLTEALEQEDTFSKKVMIPTESVEILLDGSKVSFIGSVDKKAEDESINCALKITSHPTYTYKLSNGGRALTLTRDLETLFFQKDPNDQNKDLEGEWIMTEKKGGQLDVTYMTFEGSTILKLTKVCGILNS